MVVDPSPVHIRQCEGCSDPLSGLLEEYERGEVEVTWDLCSYHEFQVSHGWDQLDYPEDEWI